MNRLLSAGFLRLWRNKIFYACLFAMVGLSVYIIFKQNSLAKEIGATLNIENVFFSYTFIIAVTLAAFVSLFFGVEYSDGVIRNKLMVGHSRVFIYLSNLIVTIVAGFVMALASIITMFAVGLPLLVFFKTPINDLLNLFITSLFVIVSLSAIYVFIAVIVSNKATVVAITLLTCFVLYAVSITVSQRLSEPEFYEGYSYKLPNDNGSITITGDQFEQTKMENPSYLRGAKRERYQFILDFIPVGQGFQITSMEEDMNLLRMQICSFGIIIVMTGAGILIFRKKNIK